ncbi:hypothetical protein B296_00029646, partial [Ensete ventricosum]
ERVLGYGLRSHGDPAPHRADLAAVCAIGIPGRAGEEGRRSRFPAKNADQGAVSCNRPNFAINDLIYKSFEYKVEPDAGQLSTAFELIGAESTSEGYKGSNSSHAKERVEDVEEKPKCVPPPGSGRRIYEIDPLLVGHRSHLDYQ